MTSCFPTRQCDKQEEALAGSLHQLANVQATIQIELIDNRTNGFDLMQAVAKLATESKRGLTVFRCESDTNIWLRINSDPHKWANSAAYTNEIAIFNPIRFYPGKTNVATIAGISFGGQCLKLSEQPKWEPLPVWEFRLDGDQ
jgi:hypothetical protein